MTKFRRLYNVGILEVNDTLPSWWGFDSTFNATLELRYVPRGCRSSEASLAVRLPDVLNLSTALGGNIAAAISMIVTRQSLGERYQDYARRGAPTVSVPVGAWE